MLFDNGLLRSIGKNWQKALSKGRNRGILQLPRGYQMHNNHVLVLTVLFISWIDMYLPLPYITKRKTKVQEQQKRPNHPYYQIRRANNFGPTIRVHTTRTQYTVLTIKSHPIELGFCSSAL